MALKEERSETVKLANGVFFNQNINNLTMWQ
jgi:hypothetical protein